MDSGSRCSRFPPAHWRPTSKSAQGMTLRVDSNYSSQAGESLLLVMVMMIAIYITILAVGV